MKASTLRNNQSHDDVTGGDRSAKPRNSDECRRRLSYRQLVVAVVLTAPIDVRDVKFSSAANVGQPSPRKDGETQPDKYSVASSNRRFSSPSGEEDGTSADRRPSLQKEPQNGELSSGRRLHKLVCRHIVLFYTTTKLYLF